MATKAGLKPWREVITPHKDVASGRYMQAEFAADLAQVYQGEGTDEYRDPEEFFRRTYMTVGLKDLLVGAVQRLAGSPSDPVVELQTNFGGGKTRSSTSLGSQRASSCGPCGAVVRAFAKMYKDASDEFPQ
jgi:hypothetical protein